MEVSEVLAGLKNSGGLVLLFDVHVERVEVELHVRQVDRLHEAEALVAGVKEVGLETVQRLDVELDALLLRVLADDLEVLDDHLEVLGLGLVVMGADEADDGIQRTDDTRATGDGSLIDEGHDVLTTGGLILGGTTKVTTRAHAGADGADGDTGAGSGGLQEPWVGMRRIFNRDFDRVEAPVLELLEEVDALVGERRGVEERIEAETHGCVVMGEERSFGGGQGAVKAGRQSESF